MSLYLRVNLVSKLISAGNADTGAGGCMKTLRKAHIPASATFVPNGADFRRSTKAIAAPCSTRALTFSGVPFAREPMSKVHLIRIISKKYKRNN